MRTQRKSVQGKYSKLQNLEINPLKIHESFRSQFSDKASDSIYHDYYKNPASGQSFYDRRSWSAADSDCETSILSKIK